MSASMDPSFYTDGAKRMSAEGIETVSKIMAYTKLNESKFVDLEPVDRKRVLLEYEPCKLFNQVHPIVFQYLATEGVFNAKAFRRYIMAVFGKPKTPEEEARMRKDRRGLYHFKNEQHALYYKYLLIETNPNVNKNTIHSMYEEVVKALNEETDTMLDAYEKAQEDAKIVEANFTEEKRKDLADLLKKKFSAA